MPDARAVTAITRMVRAGRIATAITMIGRCPAWEPIVRDGALGSAFGTLAAGM